MRAAATATSIRSQWDQLKDQPGGKEIFSQAIGRMAPYSGTISPLVIDLSEGFCRIQMEDRPEVQNHLNSIHAIALVNLAEMTSGLAMLYSAPKDARSIITGLSIEYSKKARGRITSECRCQAPKTNQRREYDFDVVLRDEQADEVARARVRWLIGPV